MTDKERPPIDHNLQLAAERTLLAWVRTGLALMGFGFVVARFGLFLRELQLTHGEANNTHHGSLPIGVSLVGLGVAILIVAAVRFHRYTGALRRGDDIDPPGQTFGVIVCVSLAVLGAMMAFFLIGVD